LVIGTLLLAALVWSVVGTETNLANLRRALPNSGAFLHRLWPPDLTWETTEARPFSPPLRLAAAAVAITLQISLLGTALGAAGALLLGLLASENLTPHWLHHPIKVVLALVRSIPIILLALLCVAAIGLGPMPGVLAVAVHSLGMLGKLYAEEFETADAGVWEALDSAGADWLQKVRFAIWPQTARQILSLTLFRFEMNLRESAVLGLVGVAGLGLWIENYRRAFDYHSVATMVLVTMLVVLVVDQAAFHTRRRLK
jgi:phosphonate transport system permease protein